MIEIISSGLYSSIQDLGRFNYEEFGVPNSGNMDKFSSMLCNNLLKNKDSDAVMEITMTGPKLLFKNRTKICITGADLSPKINNGSIEMNKVHNILEEDVLNFGKLNYGYRTYLAVKGGFITDKIMGSRSMYYPITEKQKLKNGEVLFTEKVKTYDNHSNKYVFDYDEHFKKKIIYVYPGPEFNKLNKKQIVNLTSSEFTISNNNNRMAYQLNELFQNDIDPIISSLVLSGTVQLTPSGKLIILMRDNQTCGGYPRILQLSEESINRLSQKHAGKKIKFQIIGY